MLDEKMEGALPSEPMENGVSHRIIHPAGAAAKLSEEKEIEELARAMCPYSKDSICRECSDECFYKDYAKRAVCAGWHKQSEGEWEASDIPDEKYVCSVCGGACWYYDYQGDVAKSRCCPNCGAKMKGGE